MFGREPNLRDCCILPGVEFLSLLIYFKSAVEFVCLDSDEATVQCICLTMDAIRFLGICLLRT